jgi:hypothetical protein
VTETQARHRAHESRFLYFERAVIVSEGAVLWIDESWPSTEPGTAEPATGAVSRLPPDREKVIIEAALAGTQRRVSGPFGAARKLGIPPTTLESRVRSLKINKHASNSSINLAGSSRSNRQRSTLLLALRCFGAPFISIPQFYSSWHSLVDSELRTRVH